MLFRKFVDSVGEFGISEKPRSTCLCNESKFYFVLVVLTSVRFANLFAHLYRSDSILDSRASRSASDLAHVTSPVRLVHSIALLLHVHVHLKGSLILLWVLSELGEWPFQQLLFTPLVSAVICRFFRAFGLRRPRDASR